MAGAQIFVMYLSGDGTNVTVSPRLGVGHVEPEYNQAAQITLLEGSGVANGSVTANVKCSSCGTWDGGSMEFGHDSSGIWIYATKKGTPIRSDELNAEISYHDDHGGFNWQLADATGGNHVNPFLSEAAVSALTSSVGGEPSMSILTAHAVLACLSVAFILPIGGILIRVGHSPNLVQLHMGIQYLGLAIFIAAFGLGAYFATQEDYWDYKHPIIGTLIFALMLCQPFFGILHHYKYKQILSRNIFSWFHLSVGRVIILLGKLHTSVRRFLWERAHR